MLDNVERADFVVIVCTEANHRRLRGHEAEGKGLGATYEGNLILSEIVNAGPKLGKFIPVGFDSHSVNMTNIPEPLRDRNYYDLSDSKQYDSLYFHLTRQTEITKPPLGTPRKRNAPKEPETSEEHPAKSASLKGAKERLNVSSSGPPLGGLFDGSGVTVEDVPPTSAQKAKSAVALLAQCPSGLPLSVLSDAVGSEQSELVDVLRGEIGAGEIVISGQQWSLVSCDGVDKKHFPQAYLPIVLRKLFGYIDYHGTSIQSRKQIPTVAELAKICLPYDPEMVSTVFHEMNSHLKRTGDKDIVWEMAKLSIEAARGLPAPKSDASVKGEVIALVCGLCWVHQREGELLKARAYAEESLRLGGYIPWRRNDAFCKKCLGRILRLEAVEEVIPEKRDELFRLSVQSLRDAINLFGQLEDGDKDDEIGDCYSLLGRTYLESWRLEDANEAIYE